MNEQRHAAAVGEVPDLAQSSVGVSEKVLGRRGNVKSFGAHVGSYNSAVGEEHRESAVLLPPRCASALVLACGAAEHVPDLVYGLAGDQAAMRDAIRAVANHRTFGAAP
ncbi:MAG: hypothetical protein ACRDLS_07590 [Solirubrobacteraceae bacterium]